MFCLNYHFIVCFLIFYIRDECKKIAAAEEWDAMCQCHNPIGYRNFIFNRASSISKMTKNSQQYDSPSVLSILSARNPSNFTLPKKQSVIQQKKITSTFGSTLNLPLKKNISNSQPNPKPDVSSVVIIPDDDDDISDFSSSEGDDIPLIDLC